MIRIEADTLEEAYSKAAAELTCSVTQISFSVIQNPSLGFLGMFKKSAIVEARRTGDIQKKRASKPKERGKKLHSTPAPSRAKEELKRDNSKPRREKFKSKVEVDVAVPKIREEINSLFSHSCFELNEIKVEAYNDDTVLIEFSGEDSALLIGKEGYRYKALSYLLYNWINIKYSLNVRLEIAEFLKNQEEMIAKYLVGVIERVNKTGRAQTKILDGVLVKIALEALREEFSDKYVGVKSSRDGGRFIVINDFNRKK
jgi:spoIIIJ-associated protein